MSPGARARTGPARARGGYVLAEAEGGAPAAVIVATGAEAQLAIREGIRNGVRKVNIDTMGAACRLPCLRHDH